MQEASEDDKQVAAKMTGAEIDARMLFYESKGMWVESFKMQRGLLKQTHKEEDMKGQIQVFPQLLPD